MITRIGPKHQITIPKEAFEELGLQRAISQPSKRGDAIYLIPQRLIPRDQAWFWSKGWQEKEREADEAIAQGEFSGPFNSAHDLIRHLNKE